jgi:hypothetical protein
MELKTLSDFQKLESFGLTASELKGLIESTHFFNSPKNHEAIKRKHSALIDKILGFRTSFHEEMLMTDALGFDPDGSHETWGPDLHQGVQSWIGLDIDTLQTPYCEILRILQLLKLKPFQTVVDLGAAYGRMGVVIGALYMKTTFIGYEYVRTRVDEGNRIFKTLGLNRCELREQNLFSPDFKIPDADIFFIYDFGQVEHIDQNLKQLEKMAYKRPVKLAVKGKYTKEIISKGHPWLQPLYEGKASDSFNLYAAYII